MSFRSTMKRVSSTGQVLSRRTLLKFFGLSVVLYTGIVFIYIPFLLNRPANGAKNEVGVLPKSPAEHERAQKNSLTGSPPCNISSTWIELNELIYFKRTGAFYIADLQLLRFFYVANSRIPFNLSLQVNVKVKGRVINREDFSQEDPRVQTLFFYPYGNYMVKIIQVQLKLNESVRDKASLFVYFLSNGTRTEQPLVAQTKRSGQWSAKSSAVVCSKCFFLSSENDYKDFSWWLKLNRMIGYDRVSFCDSNLNLTYFRDQADFIETSTMKCIPNFVKTKLSYQKYLTSLTELKYRGVFSYPSTDVFNVIVTNECFLRNFDRYKYVAVIDNDETMIPRMSKSYTTLNDYHRLVLNVDMNAGYTNIHQQIDAIKCDSNSNPIEKYVDKLHANFIQPNTSTVSFYFQQGFYINDKVMERLLDIIDQQLTLRGEFQPGGFNLNLSSSASNFDGVKFNFSFRIENEEDFQYAKNLVKLSKFYVRPFMAKNAKKLARVSENYRRVFALISDGDNQFTMGKSVHTTNHTHSVCVHALCDGRDRRVNQSEGHLAHFRRTFGFRKLFVFNIKQIIFDLNYFNCFVKPVLNKLEAS